jgi:hypothetical protein
MLCSSYTQALQLSESALGARHRNRQVRRSPPRKPGGVFGFTNSQRAQ